jgi:hypothetical protein
MDANYHAYGITYHDVDAKTGEVKEARKVLKWDPTEPLSAELLALAKEIAPIDLPLYASNGLTKTRGRVTIPYGSRAGQICTGVNSTYKNTYGSTINAGWYDGDPWPTVIQSNRYLSVVNTRKVVSQ